MNIAVFAPDDSWHFLDLQRAAGDRYNLISCDFRKLAASVGPRGESQVLAGSIDLNNVSAVILRIMPRGSLQQIVLRMDILGTLHRAGKRVVNNPRTIETAVDKYLTLSRLAENRIPVPRTTACENPLAAIEAFDRFQSDVVIKPLFGSMGQGIKRINDRSEAKHYFEQLYEAGEVCYVQRFVEHGDSDFRLLVIGERVLGMRRSRAGHWLTNIASGADGSAYEPNSCEINLAKKAASAVGAEIAGVDLMYDSSTGKPLIVEVNAAPGWQAISEILKVDVAEMILEQVANKPN